MSTQAMWPYLAGTMAVALPLRMLKISVGANLLRGLYVFLVPDDDNQVANQQLAQLSRKQQKKLEKSKKHQVALGGSETMMMYVASPSYVESLVSFQQLENALVFLMMFLVNLLLSIVGHYYLGMPANPLAQPMAALVIITLFTAMLELELFSQWTLSGEKVVILATGFASLVTSWLLLLLGPKYVLDFKVEEGTKQLGRGLLLLMAKINPELAEGRDTVKVEPVLVALMLAHGAGVVGTMMLTAAMRYAKLLLFASSPPAWGHQYFKTGALMKVLLALSLLMPGAAAVLWVQPLVEVMGLSAPTVQLLQPLVVLAAGLLNLMVMRKLMQAFLMTALAEWWVGKNGAASDVDALASQRLRARNAFINTVLPTKVALQLLTPATVFIALGAIMLLQILPGLVGGSSSSTAFSSFVHSCSGFLAWWSALWWFLVTSLTVTFGRLGFLDTHPAK